MPFVLMILTLSQLGEKNLFSAGMCVCSYSNLQRLTAHIALTGSKSQTLSLKP